jgi:hypothetical protein
MRQVPRFTGCPEKVTTFPTVMLRQMKPDNHSIFIRMELNSSEKIRLFFVSLYGSYCYIHLLRQYTQQ